MIKFINILNSILNSFKDTPNIPTLNVVEIKEEYGIISVTMENNLLLTHETLLKAIFTSIKNTNILEPDTKYHYMPGIKTLMAADVVWVKNIHRKIIITKDTSLEDYINISRDKEIIRYDYDTGLEIEDDIIHPLIQVLLIKSKSQNIQ